MLETEPIRSLDELRRLLKSAIAPSLCRRATQDDYVQTVIDIQQILEELRVTEELK